MNPTKASFRRAARAFRFSLSDQQVAAMRESIFDHLMGLPEIPTAQWIHCYWPILKLREIDTRPLIQELTDAGKRFVIPSVSADDPFEMIGKAFEPGGETRRNRWGTLEPKHAVTVNDSDVDLVIVPALCADRQGHRIGYGMGFYDRFLARTTCPTVVLVYSDCLHATLPHQEHDQMVDIVITENEIVRTD